MNNYHDDVQMLHELKERAGSHSPSMMMLESLFPNLPKPLVDACFIRNPFASDLFLRHLQHALSEAGYLEYLISYYPSQNVENCQNHKPCYFISCRTDICW